ncbi:MAG: PKD domain-containing protein, partial [Marinilabiliaceae bacterium]|nr:PKD domain-containing protein [Marinilabiliaceae bacterium]
EDGNHTETKTGYINVVGQEEKTYVLVTSMSEVEDGAQYLFVSEKNDIDYALGWQKAANRHGVPVVVDGNTITTTPAVIVTPTQDEVYPYEITIISEDSHWLLYDALNGKYLRPRTGVDNGLVLNDLKAYWDFSIESGLPLLVCTGSEDGVTFDRNILRFNPNGTNPPLFACYATGQNDYYLYKAGEPNPMITVTPSALDFEQIKVGNVSEPLSINIAGYNLTGNITYNVTGDNAEFNIATNDWDPATGGALHITFEPSAEQEFNATLTFSSAGAENKIVTLTGTGVSLLLPVADFIADKTAIFIEESVQFTDLSTGSPTSWEWTFTGGTPATSTLQNPIVEYNTVGVFDVSLTVTNEDGNHTETKIGYINVVVQPEKTYVLVTSFEEIEDGGQYLFVSAKNDIDYALGWQKASNRHGVPVVVEGNTITTFPAVIVTPSQDEIHPYEITIISEDDNWLLYDALNGKYLRPRTGTDNGLVLNDLKAYWDFSIESGLPSLVCTGSEDDITFDRNILRFNPNGANPPLFACYASGQNDYYLYKAGEPNPMIMVSPTLLDFEEVYIDFISEPLTINVAGYNLTDNINYILSGDDVEAFEITETEWDAAVGGILSVIFAPTEEKIYEATIVISSVGADNKTVTLVGSGAPVGIDKISQAHGIDVHPNPFVDVVYFSNIQIIERVTVTNVLGQKIMDFKPVHNKIDMSNLSKGIYLVSFQSKDGMIEVKKVVKQ